MLRLSLALSSLSVLLISTAAHGQSLAKPARSINETGPRDVNAKAIAALKRLDEETIVYRSRADFEDGRKLARVPLRTFEHELMEVSAEVQPLLDQVSDARLKRQLTNALESFRDGVFWWRKIDQPRVISVSALASSEGTRFLTDEALLATMPYTVAIHWRQAHAYLNQSAKLLSRQTRDAARQTLR